ncbi:GerMN domain-containing protein [Lederbergia galactosidilytica]|uniref:Sporulation protein n=1 Tax=Lederbergia galactosidilytica TaxID=217031 RepID=A0A178A2U1_9BACI|nr:GerMN domain-containing protein [Lederbergia galactosidilytica]KRG14435.1 sporulation protein [Virgibacillus soli]MBP1914964.1 germination protein M [Lederbergia galactosidilytica]OAK74243.1 sporulation protein [Lederbergia galactosidilytica]
MSKKAKMAFTLAGILTASMVLTGCGLFGKDKESVDPPGEVTQMQEGEELETTSESTKETADTQMWDLYLVDKNGYVVAQSIQLPKTESVAKQVLSYLVTDGPISEVLPNGFRTVIPAGTEVDVDIKDGVAVVDFSEEFSEYNEADEQNILQSVTWTLTQFDSVDSVELRVNGYALKEMPVGGTPISEDGLTRADGINTDASNVADITNTRPVTVYYLSQAEGDPYYVPVTKRISNTEEDDVAAVINQLVDGPGLQTALSTALFNGVKLVDEPTVEDGNVVLDFNESILESSDSNMISDAALSSIVLSLTEQEDIKSVSIKVNGNNEIVKEDGEALTAPVNRPEKVNVGSF